MGPWSSGSLHTKDLPRGVKKKFSPGIVCSVTVPVLAAYWKSLNIFVNKNIGNIMDNRKNILLGTPTHLARSGCLVLYCSSALFM